MFSIETGCPPDELQGNGNKTKRYFFLTIFLVNFFQFIEINISLERIKVINVKASSIVQSIAWALRNSIWPLVVSKCEFPGIILPSFTKTEKEHFLQHAPGELVKDV